MRSFFLSFFLLIFCSMQSSAQPQRVITREQLPVAAEQFLSKFFPSADIATLSEQSAFAGREYDVFFHNGTHIEFSSAGEWREVSSREALPQGIVPPTIQAYVSEHYPSQSIRHIERSRKEWEVGLANGFELKFDRDFRLIDVDD